jgi:hypothetical protein
VTRARLGGAGLALALGLAALPGCGGLGTLLGPPPESGPGSRAGWLAYRVDGLRFEAPAGWSASGDARRVTLEADGLKLEAWAVEGRFADARACLAAAEEALARGAERLTRVRRHTSALAGRNAVAQEADAGGWPGWAYGVCDGPLQYRLFFTGRSPIPAEVLEAWRAVVASARLGGVS